MKLKIGDEVRFLIIDMEFKLTLVKGKIFNISEDDQTVSMNYHDLTFTLNIECVEKVK